VHRIFWLFFMLNSTIIILFCYISHKPYTWAGHAPTALLMQKPVPWAKPCSWRTYGHGLISFINRSAWKSGPGRSFTDQPRAQSPFSSTTPLFYLGFIYTRTILHNGRESGDRSNRFPHSRNPSLTPPSFPHRWRTSLDPCRPRRAMSRARIL
jgi:hypothetical protein